MKEQRVIMISRIAEALSECSTILVVSHIDPDGDALGSMLAMDQYLRDSGKQVTSVCDSEIPDKYKFLPGANRILDTRSLDASKVFDAIVVLECPEQSRVGASLRFFETASHVLVIDHHHGNRMFGTVNWVEPAASSVAEMLFQYFQATGYEISPTVADCLYTGLLTDTGRFRYGSTSASSFQMAAYLREAGADIRGIVDRVYYQMPQSSLRMLGQVLSNMEYHADNRICVLMLTNAIREATGATDSDSDGLAEYSLYTTGVEVGLIFKETTDGAVKVSIRTYDRVDAQEIASQFNGGGHKNAAGCKISGALSDVKPKVLAATMQAVEKSDHAK